MDVNNENNLYDFLIKSMDALCIKQKLTQIPYMNCAVLIGTNKDDYMNEIIEQLIKNNAEATIIILAKESMLNNINIKSHCIETIITDEKYSKNDYIKIKQVLKSKKVDGFFFRGQNYNEVGNKNVLEIAKCLYNDNHNLNVYGTNMDGDIYKYKNIKIYMDGLYLYEKMNDYIDEVLGIL
jgi:hypothetical protein